MVIITASAGKQKNKAKVEINRPKYANLLKHYQKITALNIPERYKLVGGKVESAYTRSPSTYENTCAVRISYALNYGGMPIKSNTIPSSTISNIKLGNENHKYYTGVWAVAIFLRTNWKSPELKDYNPNEIKSNGSKYKAALQKLNKTGVVALSIKGWGDGATGHVTLWDGQECADGTDYFNDPRPSVIVKEIEFWELK